MFNLALLYKSERTCANPVILQRFTVSSGNAFDVVKCKKKLITMDYDDVDNGDHDNVFDERDALYDQ